MCSLPFPSKTLCLVTSPSAKANWSTTATDCSQMFSQGSMLDWLLQTHLETWKATMRAPTSPVKSTGWTDPLWNHVLVTWEHQGATLPLRISLTTPPLPRTATPGMQGRLSGKQAQAASLQAVKCPSFLTPRHCRHVIVPSSSTPANKMDPLQALMYTVRHRGDVHWQFLSLDKTQKTLPGHYYILLLNPACCFYSRPHQYLVTGQVSTKTWVHESLRQQRRTNGSTHCQTRLRLGISKFIHSLSLVGSFLNEHNPKIYLSQKAGCWTRTLYWQKWSSCWF